MTDKQIPTDTVSDLHPTLASTLAANASLLAELDELQAALGAAQRVATRAAQIRPVPLYPDTSYLVLCTNPGRKSGRVTVGDSRLPVEMVLAVLRAHGAEEARLQWPQLGEEELAVLGQLATDLDAEGGPTRSEVEAAMVHERHCRAYGDHAALRPGQECSCTVSEVIDETVEHGWLRLAEPPVPLDEIVAAEGIEVGRVRSKGKEIGFALHKNGKRVIGVDLCRGQVHQRWIVAHCLGHLLLHDKQLIVDYQVSVNPRDETTTLGTAFEEQQANTFAAELLMPRLMVARLAAETATLETARDDVVLPLAELFQVGRDAMVSRLIALGVIQP